MASDGWSEALVDELDPSQVLSLKFMTMGQAFFDRYLYLDHVTFN